MNLNQHVAQLELAAQVIAEGEDKARKGEANNILQVIWDAKDLLNEGNFSEADEILDSVAKRINFLIENPSHSGNHEIHRTQADERIRKENRP